MGGCRCSYLNCTAKSDGKTHLFHFPVFDKVRCHQWIINSRRLDYLNLTVKQLKNRVVCQHHFKDNQFMNFKKDKLKFNAVPTENGPLCDSSKFNESDLSFNTLHETCPITVEDIENDAYTTDGRLVPKGMKYGDFLTNGDLTELDCYNPPTKDNIMCVKKEEFADLKEFVKHGTGYNSTNKGNNKILCRKSSLAEGIKKNLKPTWAVQPFLGSNKGLITAPQTSQPSDLWIDIPPNINLNNITQPDNVPKTVDIKIPEISSDNINQIDNEFKTQDIKDIQMLPNLYINTSNENYKQLDNVPSTKQVKDIQLSQNLPGTLQVKNNKKESKVRIISEKRIHEPLRPITGKLRPISTNIILPMSSKRKMVTDDTISSDVSSQKLNNAKVDAVPIDIPLQTNIINSVTENILNNTIDQNDINDIKKPITSCTPSVEVDMVPNKARCISHFTIPNPKKSKISFIRKSISPRKAAEVERRRRFNMDLNNVLNNGLINDLLEQMSSGSVTENNTESVIENLKAQKNESEFSLLEARVSRMEKVLLNGLNQTCNKLEELKNSLVPNKKPSNVSTQTSVSNELHKKYLYHEISKYLSPDTNSLIYEELFINKYARTNPKDTYAPSKRKKGR